MSDSLFPAAAAPAAAWPPVSAAATDATHEGEDATSAFAEILAVTAGAAAPDTGADVAPAFAALSLADVWLGALTSASQDVITRSSSADAAPASVVEEQSDEGAVSPDLASPDVSVVSWAVPIPVPVPIPLPKPVPSPEEDSAAVLPELASQATETRPSPLPVTTALSRPAVPDRILQERVSPPMATGVETSRASQWHPTAPGAAGTPQEGSPGGWHHPTASDAVGTPQEGSPGGWHPTAPDAVGTPQEGSPGGWHPTAPDAVGTPQEGSPGGWHPTAPDAVGTPREGSAPQAKPFGTLNTEPADPATDADPPVATAPRPTAARVKSDARAAASFAPIEVESGTGQVVKPEGSEPARSSVTTASVTTTLAGADLKVRPHTSRELQARSSPQAPAVTPEIASPAASGFTPELPAPTPDEAIATESNAPLRANRQESAATGQRTDSIPHAAAFADLLREDGGSSQNGAARHALAAAFREPAAVGRSPDAPRGLPVFTTTSDPVTRTVLLQTAAPQPPVMDTAAEAENLGRLVESMRVQWRQGVPEATVRLKPEHMGEVTIAIRVDRGAVSAVVHADTPGVQQWLESQEERLRSGLAEQGLQLERFVVQRERQERRDQRQQPPPRYRQPREQGQRFEVSA